MQTDSSVEAVVDTAAVKKVACGISLSLAIMGELKLPGTNEASRDEVIGTITSSILDEVEA